MCFRIRWLMAAFLAVAFIRLAFGLEGEWPPGGIAGLRGRLSRASLG
jgi:hypothetical protein